jgi:hypothetical protein
MLLCLSDHKKEGLGPTIVYRCVWKPSKGKKIEAAMKTLKTDYREKYMKVFIRNINIMSVCNTIHHLFQFF